MAEGGEPGSAPGLVARVLGYADRPWKAVAVIVAVIIGGVGWGVWQERDRLIEAWRERGQAAVLDRAALPAALAGLLVGTGADIVAAWSVDLGANAARFEQGRRRGGGAWVFAPERVPALTVSSSVQRTVQFLAGHAACRDPAIDHNLILRRLIDDGMHRLCVVPIDADSQTIIGVLGLAWHDPPDAAAEEAAIGAADEVAARLVTRWSR